MSKKNSASSRYEMMFIIRDNVTESDRKKLLDEVRGFVKETSAKIFHEDDWGLRKLAYRIKGDESGYYFIFYFEDAKPSMLKELDVNMTLNQHILRHLVTKIPQNYQILPMEELAGTQN